YGHRKVRDHGSRRAGNSGTGALYDWHRRGPARTPEGMSELGVLQEGRLQRAARAQRLRGSRRRRRRMRSGVLALLIALAALLLFMASSTSGPTTAQRSTHRVQAAAISHPAPRSGYGV